MSKICCGYPRLLQPVFLSLELFQIYWYHDEIPLFLLDESINAKLKKIILVKKKMFFAMFISTLWDNAHV